MEEIHELLGYNRIKIFQRKDMFSFSLDSMLLADFIVFPKKAKKVIELGCGNAPILLFSTMKTDAHLVGIEIQKEICDLGNKSVKINGFENQIEIINNDLVNIYRIVGANTFDVVISNPPFFKYTESSIINKNDFLTIARHEVKVKLEEIVQEARKLLVDGGSFYMVHRTSRFCEVVNVLSKYNFGRKRIRFIYSKEGSSDSLMFLIEAKFNRKDDVKVLKPLYVYNNNEQYTDEVMTIFNFMKE